MTLPREIPYSTNPVRNVKLFILMKDFLTTEDWFMPPRARGHFFQYFRYEDIVRTPAQYKALKRIVARLYDTLPSCNRTYRTGNRKNFEKAIKQHREALRHITLNMLQSFVHGSAVFIPLGKYYWDGECKKKNSMVNYTAMKDVMNDMLAQGYMQRAAKHYHNGNKDRSNATAYIPTDKMIYLLWETNKTLFDPPVQKKPPKHHDGWTNIHIKSADKKSREYLLPGEIKEDKRFKKIFTTSYGVLKSIKTMEQYTSLRKQHKLILRVSLGHWLALPATSKRHFLGLVSSSRVLPVAYSTVDKTFSRSELQSIVGKVRLRLRVSDTLETLPVIEKKTDKIIRSNETIIRGETNSKKYKEIEVHKRLDSFDDFTIDILGIETIDYELIQEDLYRVFNEDGEQGGRFYGSVVQVIPKELRKKCLYVSEGGELKKMVELDYACHHVSILRTLEGLKDNGNSYGDATGEIRDERKIALLTALNAGSYNQAVEAIRVHFMKVLGYRGEKLTGHYIAEVLDQVERLNSDIASKHFYTGVGAKLQAVDSFIACQVMSEYMREYNGVIECIHDSFMVREEDKAGLARIMVQEYKGCLGTINTPTITS